MATLFLLSSAQVRQVGEVLYGPRWQRAMADDLGVPRQSVGHYLKSGVKGAHAAAVIGLVARIRLGEAGSFETARRANQDRIAVLDALLAQLHEMPSEGDDLTAVAG
jgi:hypothetical protein